LVLTETLINDTVEVAVNSGVGVCVSVGVRDGVNVNSGVGVNSNVGDGSSTGAPSVKPAITVCAAAVLMLPASGVAIPGTEQAALTSNKMNRGEYIFDKRIMAVPFLRFFVQNPFY
jgi:hypothetical protein